MSKIQIDPRKLILLERSNNLLENTKKFANKYSKERKILLDFTSKKEVDLEEWSVFLENFEKNVQN